MGSTRNNLTYSSPTSEIDSRIGEWNKPFHLYSLQFWTKAVVAWTAISLQDHGLLTHVRYKDEQHVAVIWCTIRHIKFRTKLRPTACRENTRCIQSAVSRSVGRICMWQSTRRYSLSRNGSASSFANVSHDMTRHGVLFAPLLCWNVSIQRREGWISSIAAIGRWPQPATAQGHLGHILSIGTQRVVPARKQSKKTVFLRSLMIRDCDWVIEVVEVVFRAAENSTHWHPQRRAELGFHAIERRSSQRLNDSHCNFWIF